MFSSISGIAIAAAPSSGGDPGGWSAAKWGMTPAQLLEAVPGAARLEGKIPKPERTFDGITAEIGIPQIDVGKEPARIFFICDSSTGLREVIIQFADDTAEAYARLELQLVQRYGRPWARTTENTQSSQWTRAYLRTPPADPTLD